MSRIFVSHASEDSPLVKAFVDTILRLGCVASHEEIFFSSGADTGVPVGADLNSFVRQQISEKDTLVVAIVTPTFLARPYCVAELGAAWSRAGSLFPLVLPEMGHALEGVLNGLLVKAIDDRAGLDELSDRVAELLGRRPTAMTWSHYRDKWLAELPVHLRSVVVRGAEEILSIACCSRGEEHMEVFWSDRSSRVFYRWWIGGQGWSQVEQLADVEADYLAAVGADGEEMLFGVKGTGEMWVRSWELNEKGWESAGKPRRVPGIVTGPISAVARGWAVEVIAWTSDGQPCHLWREGEGWAEWSTEW
jgi:hypothetical protein